MLVSQTVTYGMFVYGDTNVYSDIDISPDSKSPSQTEVTLANFDRAMGGGISLLRRFPLNVRAVAAKIKLPKKYLQHSHILRTDKKNLSMLLIPG